jgi:DegV family protein with EDD domain
MKKVQVFTDSTSDIEKEYRDEVGLDYLKMVFTIEGKNYDADLEWPEITPKAYYDMMRKGSRAVTGQVKPSDIEEKFKKAFEEGYDVLYIACSSRLSSSVNSAKIYADEILAKYPGRKAVCYDSLRSNYAEGLMAFDVAKMANEGKTLDELVEYLDNNRLKYQVVATVESLEWLRKSGRVTATSAFFGNLFGVKPIIISDKNGNNYAFKKVKGRKTSLDELVSIIAERIENPEQSYLFIENADCEKDAEYVKSEISKKINIKEIFISSIGPIVGSTVGPDSITVNFYGKEVEIAGEE